MANTSYVLIDKITVGAAKASSITFSSIPQTGYTDLVLKSSTRSDGTGLGMGLTFNGISTNRLTIGLYGSGSNAATYSGGQPLGGLENTSDFTANTFSNCELYISNYTSASNNKSSSSDAVTENNATLAYAFMNANSWSATSAITSITLTPESSNNFVQYSTFYLYGVAKLGTTPAIFPKATGGDTIMTDGTYWYHAFLASGTFTPASALTCDYLVVAGGGGGGNGASSGGGGGAGGYLTSTGYSTSASTNYTVTIGAGGVGSANDGTQGSNSVFATITSTGGGYGGRGGNNGVTSGGAGGSGGGAGGSGGGNAGSGFIGGAASPSGQGNAGGNGASGGTYYGAGGGGGAGAVGVAAVTVTGGNGGAGLNTLSSWFSTTGTGASGYVAGGGGGGTNEVNTGYGLGGAGGGGRAGYWNGSVQVQPVAGTANTGGGGGGGGSSNINGASGGSGLVIVRYAV